MTHHFLGVRPVSSPPGAPFSRMTFLSPSGNAGSETAMKRIVKIEGVGNVAFPSSMTDAEVSQAAGRLYDDATLTNVPRDEDTSTWRHIQTSDGQQHMIHPEDLAEAQRRDPALTILSQPNQP